MPDRQANDPHTVHQFRLVLHSTFTLSKQFISLLESRRLDKDQKSLVAVFACKREGPAKQLVKVRVLRQGRFAVALVGVLLLQQLQEAGYLRSRRSIVSLQEFLDAFLYVIIRIPAQLGEKIRFQVRQFVIREPDLTLHKYSLNAYIPQ